MAGAVSCKKGLWKLGSFSLPDGRTRDNVHKLKQGRFQFNIKEENTAPYGIQTLGKDCPERLHNLHLWKFSRPTWINFWGDAAKLRADSVLSSKLSNRPHDISSNLKNSKKVPQRKYYSLYYHRKIQLWSWITIWKLQGDVPMECAIHTLKFYLKRLLESSRATCKYLAPVLSCLSFTAVRNSSGTAVTCIERTHLYYSATATRSNKSWRI